MTDAFFRRRVSRRRVLAAAAVAATLGPRPLGAEQAPGAAGAAPAPNAMTTPVPMPDIRSRSEWDEGRGPVGAIEPEEVKFLVVHHTAEPGNDYVAEDVPRLLRGIYNYHTGPAKDWPDIAYNFMIDRFGRIFEARAGSIAGPVRGSATGGNQGYAQLCCFLGNHAEVPPTPEAQAAMIDLLAWLAQRYQVPVAEGSPIEFESLGSNRWPAGTTVTVDPIAAHRDVSQTTCPGDACMDLVRSGFPAAVSLRLTPPPTTTTSSSTTTTAAPTTVAATTPTSPPATEAPAPDGSAPGTLVPDDGQAAAGDPTPGGGSGGLAMTEVALGGLVVAGAALAVSQSRRRSAAGASVAHPPVAVTPGPVMPFYLCLDGTMSPDTTAVMRTTMADLTRRIAPSPDAGSSAAAEAVRLGIVSVGRQPELAMALTEVREGAILPVLERAGPVDLGALFSWLEGLLHHDVTLLAERGTTALRPVVLLALGSPTAGPHDAERFRHLTTTAPIRPVVVTFGFGQADPATIERFSTVGSSMALPATVPAQLTAIGRAISETIAATAAHIMSGPPSLQVPTTTPGLEPFRSGRHPS